MSEVLRQKWRKVITNKGGITEVSKIYDVIVLGAGPAGLAAGLYAGRSRLSVLILEKGQDGGQIEITDETEK